MASLEDQQQSGHHSSDETAINGNGSLTANGAHTDEQAVLNELFPSDSWTPEGVYWADLPTAERRRFVNEQQGGESHRIWANEWADFKRDPLLPLINYWHNYVLPGMGLFTEGYILFSIGTIKALFQKAFPTCWTTFAVCNKTWTQSTDYLQIVGIMLGQCLVGLEGDWVGRRWGLIQDATIMTIGIVLLTSVWGAGGSLQGWVIGYALSQLIYGVGVGGEYPMTATLAMERASSAMAGSADRLHRGRRTVGAFLMQGWGQVINQAVLIILLLIFNGGGSAPYSEGTAQATYRVQFGFIGLFVLWLLYFRIFRLKGANTVLNAAKASANVSGYDSESLGLTLRFFWHRLFATSFGWFCNDFFFYGNKIFASEFLAILYPGESSVVTSWLYNLLNTFIALIGYYCAFIFIDDKRWGRVRMQTTGFLLDGVIFLCCAAAYNQLNQPGAPIKAFQFLYFFSSFWAQFGPNCVTFLVAAEVYPASIRGSAHGTSAALGKIGALIPTVVYNYAQPREKFWIVWPFALAGAFVTLVFLPDTTGLDLREQERRWSYMRAGREHDYHGIAIHPRHLSLFECWVLKQHRYYDPKLDRQQRFQELREMWQRRGGSKGGRDIEKSDNFGVLSPEMEAFFEKEAGARKDGQTLPASPRFDGLLGTAKTGQAVH